MAGMNSWVRDVAAGKIKAKAKPVARPIARPTGQLIDHRGTKTKLVPAGRGRVKTVPKKSTYVAVPDRPKNIGAHAVAKVVKQSKSTPEKRIAKPVTPGAIGAKGKVNRPGLLAAVTNGLLGAAHLKASPKQGKQDTESVRGPASIKLPVSSTIIAPGNVALYGGRAGNDAIDMATNAIPSAYYLGKTALTDPKKLPGMLLEPYKQAVEHPLESFQEHPLQTGLLLYGLKGAVGRGAGKALRTAPSKTLRKLGSTDRPAATRTVYDTSVVERGRYSKDSIDKVVQVAVDKARKRRATRPDAKPNVLPDKRIAKRVDRSIAVNEDMRRFHRGEVNHAATKALGKKPTAATTLAAQNIIDASLTDLKAYRAQVARHVPTGAADKRTHTATLKALDEAIKKHDPGRVEASASASRAIGAPLQQRMARKTGLLDPVEAERASLKPYAIQKMGARDNGTKLVAHDGSDLSNAQILAHMKAHDVEAPAFVTHQPNQRGAVNYYVSQMRPPAPISGRRTGKAVKTGVMDVHPDTLVESAVKAQGRIDSAEGYGRLIREFGYKPGGRLKVGNRRKITKIRDDLNAEAIEKGGTQFEAVRLVPQFSRKSQHDVMHDYATEGDAIIAAVKGEGEGGQWVLIPKAAADRIAAHAKGDGTDPLVRAFGSAFRTTVLATNPRWLAGNAIEGGLRTAVAHAGPRSAITNKRVMRSIERQYGPDARAMVESRTQGGGMYGTRARLSKKVNPDKLPSQGVLGKTVQLAKAAGQTPAPRAVAKVWNGYTHVVFDIVNKRVETGLQGAMAGKAIRDSPLMADRTMKMTRTAVDQAARGLVVDLDLLSAIARDVEVMYGKYGAWGPNMKRYISSYTPFIPWTLNAIRFLAVTMPRDHPVLTSLLAAAGDASREWREENNLTASFTEALDGLPDYLQGSIPGADGSHLRLSRYTPFGVAASEGGPLGALAESVLPQISGALENAQGRDWKGTSLAGPGKESPKFDNGLAVITSFLTAGIPLLGQGAKAAGIRLPNEAPPSKAKAADPPDLAQRLRNALDPFMYTPAGGAKPRAHKLQGGVQLPNVALPNVELPNVTLP